MLGTLGSTQHAVLSSGRRTAVWYPNLSVGLVARSKTTRLPAAGALTTAPTGPAAVTRT